MPLTKKGEKIKRAMKEQYGGKKGEQVFYASEKAGTIKGVKAKHDGLVKRVQKKLNKIYGRKRKS
jgi:hypothetical protein